MAADAGVRKRATVTNKAGGSTRVMAASRLAVALSALIMPWLGLFVYANNIRTIVALGLPATLILAVGSFLGIKYLEKKVNTAIDRAKHTEKGAGAEEKVGDFLDSLPSLVKFTGIHILNRCENECGNLRSNGRHARHRVERKTNLSVQSE